MNQKDLQLAIQNNNLGQAIAEMEKARTKASTQGDTKALALSSNDLGVMYYVGGRYVEARLALEVARDAFVKSDDLAGQGRAAGNLARLEDQEGHTETAIALYSQAADFLHQAHSVEDEAATLEMLGALYGEKGNWMQSLAAQDRALLVKPNKGAFDSFIHALYRIPLRLMGM